MIEVTIPLSDDPEEFITIRQDIDSNSVSCDVGESVLAGTDSESFEDEEWKFAVDAWQATILAFIYPGCMSIRSPLFHKAVRESYEHIVNHIENA